MFAIVNGGTPTPSAEHWDGNVPWATPVDLGEDEFYINETARSLTDIGLLSGSRQVPPGSILLSTRAPIGYLSVTRVPMAFNQGCRALVPRSNIDIRFVGYQLMARRSDLEAQGQGSTFMELSGEALARFRISVPSLGEQRRIADFLEDQVGLLDQAIALRQHQAALVDERFTSLREEAFLHLRSDTVGLRYAADFFSDGDWVESPFIAESGIRLIQTGNVGVGYYKDQGFRYVSEETFQYLDCTEVHPGDLLISRLSPPVGRACVAPDVGGRMIVSVDVAIVRSSRLDHGFLAHYMSTRQHLDALDMASRGATMARVSRSQLGSFPVPLPDRETQLSVTARLNEERASAERALVVLAKSEELLAERKQALIAATVVGQFDVSTARSVV